MSDIKTAIITGATRGIGKSIAECLENNGFNLILTGTNQEKINALNNNSPEHIKYICLDLNDEKSVSDFTDFLRTIEQIDVYVNNAGINRIERIEDISITNFDDVMNVNLRSAFYITQVVAKKMMQQKIGKIINIASIWSKITREGRVSYITSKSALDGFTRGLATDLAPHNILVNTVSPGFVMTELTDQSLTEEEKSKLCSQVPLNRFAEPKEIAELVSFLTSSKNTYITGQNIVIDGGYTNV